MNNSSAIKQMPRSFLVFVVLVSIVLLCATFYGGDAGRDSRVALQLSFAGENTLGAWWSSGLLFLVGLHAMDAFFFDAGKQRSSAAVAWLTLGVACVCLSADEGGSLHERIAIFGQDRGYEWYVTLIPFALILLGMIGVTLWKFIAQREDISAGVCVLVAFAIFGLVAVQEEFQHKIAWRDDQLGLRVMIEEGSEIVAILLLLFCCMKNSGGYFSRFGGNDPSYGVLKHFSGPLMILAAVAAPLLVYFTVMMDDQQRGHPSDWLAACLLMAASLQFLRPWYEYRQRCGKAALLGLMALVGSLFAMALQTRYVMDLDAMSFNSRGDGSSLRLIALGLLLLPITFMASTGLAQSMMLRATAVVMAIVMCGLAVSGGLIAVYGLTLLASLFVFYVASKRNEQVVERFA